MVVDDGHALHFRRAQRVGDERDRVLGPFHDVDLLAAELADDRLHARTFHADARTDRIDVALAGEHGHLGAVARLADGASNHHGAVVDLGHFLLEQLDEQRRIGTREHDLRTLRAAVHALDDRADAIVRVVALGARLLLPRDDRFVASHLDDDIAVLEALDRGVDDFAHALAELGVDVFAFGLAHLLEDDLLGRLRRDPSEHFGRLREFHLVAELDAVGDVVAIERPVDIARLVEADLGRGIGDFLHDGLEREEIDLARLHVETGFQVLAGLVVLARGRRDRFLDRADHHVGLDPLFLGERFNRLLQRIAHVAFRTPLRDVRA